MNGQVPRDVIEYHLIADEQSVELDLLRGGQGVFNVIGLSAVVTDVDSGIHQLGFEIPAGTGFGVGETAADTQVGGSATRSDEPGETLEQAARAR